MLAASRGDDASVLAQNPFALRIVYHWSNIGSKTSARRWLCREARRNEFLIDLLRQASSKSRSYGSSDRVVRETVKVDTSALGRFLNLKQLKRRCAQLLVEHPTWLSEDQEKLLKIADYLISDTGQPLDERDMRRERLMSGGPGDDSE